MIGRARDEPVTPALILDLRAVERNIAEMARRMAGLPAALRPHAKIHKSPIVGQMQLDAGAIGLTTATVWEAAALIDAGLSDVLIANQAIGPVKAAELARIAALGRVIVAVESGVNARELSAAAADARLADRRDRRGRRGAASIGRALGRGGARARRRDRRGCRA